MKQYLTITYDPFTREVGIEANDFSTVEMFGILEAAKQMAAKAWFEDTDGDEIDG